VLGCQPFGNPQLSVTSPPAKRRCPPPTPQPTPPPPPPPPPPAPPSGDTKGTSLLSPLHSARFSFFNLAPPSLTSLSTIETVATTLPRQVLLALFSNRELLLPVATTLSLTSVAKSFVPNQLLNRNQQPWRVRRMPPQLARETKPRACLAIAGINTCIAAAFANISPHHRRSCGPRHRQWVSFPAVSPPTRPPRLAACPPPHRAARRRRRVGSNTRRRRRALDTMGFKIQKD